MTNSKIYYAHMQNLTDRADDRVIKIEANTKDKAIDIASDLCSIKETLKCVRTKIEQMKYDCTWVYLLDKIKPYTNK